MKSKSKAEKVKTFIVAGVVVFLILLSILAGVIFPNSLFATIVDNSIGKFFNLFDFFKNNYVTLLESVAIIFFIWLITLAIVLLLKVLTKKKPRNETVSSLLQSMVKYVAILVALFMILAAWGVQTRTLLAGAGILGLALSFGAQSLIEDVISGLFLILKSNFLWEMSFNWIISEARSSTSGFVFQR
jgi:small conductance mechanosensitive channel